MASLRIIGAGLAGLAAALQASRPGHRWDRITIEEAAPAAGGRCRSFTDPAFPEPLDNGIHVLVAANRQARAFLREAGCPAGAFLRLPPPYRFASVGRARVTPARMLRSVAVAAFNCRWEGIRPAALARLCLRTASGPALLVPRMPLDRLFVGPSLDRLAERGVDIRLSSRAASVGAGAGSCILAVPPGEAARLLPGLRAPDTFNPIVTVHYLLPGLTAPPALGLVDGSGAWLFGRTYGIAAVVSAADGWVPLEAGEIADRLWRDAMRALALNLPLPPFRVVKERRATPAPTFRPVPPTHDNVRLAGDWTEPGWPATIEAAIRSGRRAAVECDA